MRMGMERMEPGEAGIEMVVEEHLAGGVGLRLAFLGEDGEIGAALDPPFRVPRALPVPHKNHSLRRSDWGETELPTHLL